MTRTPVPPREHADAFTDLVTPRAEDLDEEPARHGRRKRRLGWIPWVAGVLVVLLVLAGGIGWFAYATFPDQVKGLFGWSNDYQGEGSGSVDVQIRSGDLGSDVANTLVKDDVTKTYAAFYQLLVSKSPEPVLSPGIYRLKHRMSAAAALAALEDRDNLVQSTVVLPEGSTVKQILAATAQSTGVPLADLQAAAKDRSALGVPKGAPNLEGWLFPATYDFPPGTKPAAMLQQMVERMKQSLDQAGVATGDREKVLTLAGLVQKEGNGDDDAKVARVFLNRIKDGMRLQSDATVSYGAGGTTVVPTSAQYKDRNGYNTYLRDGLPIGPISNPGDAAIRAAVHPASGKWLYFVTVNLQTGETKFSTTLAQHEKYSAEFSRWLKAHPKYAK